MTQINDTIAGGRPNFARRPGAGRIASRRTRVRVSSDAVISAYIHDIAQPARRRAATRRTAGVAAVGSGMHDQHGRYGMGQHGG
jgi:hypothetical protein